LIFSLLDDVKDVLLLSDVAFEGGPTDRGGDGARACRIDIGDDDLGGAGTMECLAHRLADAVGATRDNHDFAAHLHGRSPLAFVSAPKPDRERSQPWAM
jgi:hypothetical protein